MKRTGNHILLLALLATWMLVAWPHLSEQFSTTSRALAALSSLSWEERAAALDQPGYSVARQIAGAVPSRSCVLVLSHTGPEHLRYYRARFQYYLYPRRVRFSDHTNEPGAGCEYLAILRDSAQNLAQEPFRGHWEEREIAQRTARMKKIISGEQVEIFGN